MILSLQGCMAVGKTTAVSYIKENAPYVNISYETIQDVVAQIKARKLNKNIFEDYVEIQKLWIANEINRWKNAQRHKVSLMDFGAEEIEFYTLNYPRTINAQWDVAAALKGELNQLRQCLPDRILFLEASEDELRRRKENDRSRSREFFDYYIKHLLPLKKQWFSKMGNVDFLCVDQLSPQEVGQKTKDWIDKYIQAIC